jgi:hypothetical protein
MHLNTTMRIFFLTHTLDAIMIAKKFGFHLEASKNSDNQKDREPIRMAGKSWAITCRTAASSESMFMVSCFHDPYNPNEIAEDTVMAEIKRHFNIKNLQYACVTQEIVDKNYSFRLHIQIILKRKVNKKTWFLDHVTGTSLSLKIMLSSQ